MYWIRRLISKFFHLFYEKISCGKTERGRIYMLHNVGGKDENPFNITIDELEDFVKRKSNIGFTRLEFWEKIHVFNALTVDDVPIEFFYNGYPLLKKYRVPFTIFVSIGLLDTPGYITTSQLIEMAQCELCTVGSHGITHGEYTALSKEEKHKELSESKRKLEEITGKTVSLYAFPYGSFFSCGYSGKKLVLNYYKYGFCTIQIPITKDMLLPYYFIPRINVSHFNYKTI